MYMSVAGRRTYYTSLGRGWPVLILHGWGTDSSLYYPLARRLADVGFQVVVPDLPGFGRTEGPLEDESWGISDYADFVSRFAAQAGIDSATLVGHSFGGRIAIVLGALEAPWISEMVLVAAAGIRPPRNLQFHLRRLTATGTRRSLGWLPQRARQYVLQLLYNRVGMTDYARSGQLRSTFVRVVNEDLTQRLSEIKAPVLLIWGRNDEEVPIGAGVRMGQLLRDSRLEVLEAGHYPFVEAPQAFVDIVEEFVGARDRTC